MLAHTVPSNVSRWGIAACFVACGARTGLPMGAEVGAGDVGPSSGAATSDAGVGGPAGGGALTVPIYVVDDTGLLSRFDPPKAAFSPVGRIGCWPDAGILPSAMAVDRSGTIYLAYLHVYLPAGRVDRMDAATASCGQALVSEQIPNINPNGMAFTANLQRDGETLYGMVSNSNQFINLVSIDVTTFAAKSIGEIHDPRTGIKDSYGGSQQVLQLTGSNLGDLFSVGAEVALPQLAPRIYDVDRIDPTNALTSVITGVVEIAENFLDVLPAATAAYWGGNVYLFGQGPPVKEASDVMRIPLGSTSGMVVARYPGNIVLAGVQTTAPAR